MSSNQTEEQYQVILGTESIRVISRYKLDED